MAPLTRSSKETGFCVQRGKKVTNKLHRQDAIRSYCRIAYQIAESHGWHEKERTFGDYIALFHSEISEALEAYREHPFIMLSPNVDNGDKPEGVLVELADELIRIFDFVGSYNLEEQFADALERKMIYNIGRPHRHGEKAL